MKNFIKRLFGFSLGPVIGALLSLIQIPIFASLMPVEEVGNANAFQMMLVNIPNFIYLGLDQAYSREFHVYNNKKRLMQQAVTVPLIVGLILCGIFVVFSGWISEWLFNDASYYYLIWLAGVWLLSTVLERFVLMTIRMEEKAFEYSFYSLLLKIGSFGVSLLLIFLGMTDFTLIVYGLIFGQLLADMIMFYRYRSLLVISDFELDIPLIKRMLKFALPLMISTSAASVLNMMDNMFLTSMSTPVDRGIYLHAAKIAAMFGIIKTAFASFWVPTAFRWYEENKSLKHYQYISELILFCLTGVFFAILLLKEPIIIASSFGKKGYIHSQYILALLCFPHIMYTLSETTTLGISFSRKTYYNIWISLLALVPSFLCNYFLTPRWGYRGAALASTIAYIVFYCARTYFSKKTGFYFSQRKHLLSILLMFLAAILNMYEVNYSSWITVGIGIITFIIQFSTVIKTFDIRNHPQAWDFT